MPFPYTKDTYTLSTDELACIADFDAGVQQALRDAQNQRAGMFRMIARSHNLTGNWSLSSDGKSMIRGDQPQPAPPQE